MTDPHAPLIAWGVDPIYFGSEKLGREHLDRVSTTRPVAVIHMSIHLMGANTAALHDCGIFDDCQIEGVVKKSGRYAARRAGGVRRHGANPE